VTRLRASELAAPLSAVVLVSLALVVAIGTALGSPVWIGALRASVFDTALTVAVASLIGVSLGFLAGSGIRLAETVLGRAVEVTAALPTALLAAAGLAWGSHFTSVALALGLVRGLEVAAVLAHELSVSREAARLEAQSHVGLPLSVYYRSAFPRALGPALTTLALTPAWLAGVDVTLVLLRAGPLANRLSLGALAGRGELWPIGLILLLTVALYGAGRWAARRFDPDGAPATEAVALPLRRRVSATAETDQG
jgi:ABC-type dipeptide/oligopeptide/nickel transport system permease subunit